jgi:alpha-1,3-rhamnosyl/mannosyltransferase
VFGDGLIERLGGLGLRPGYLLHVGTIEPRKNLLMLLRAYSALPDSLRQSVPLVLVGLAGAKSEEVVELLRGEARHKNVRWTNYVPDECLPSLYSGALALLLPSHLEGFGTTAVEMMAVGGVVIASSAGALPETTAGRAHLLDPSDETGWRDTMLRVCRDRDWRHSLRRGVEEVAARYDWDRCAELTLGVYRRVLSGRNVEVKGAAHARAA